MATPATPAVASEPEVPAVVAVSAPVQAALRRKKLPVYVAATLAVLPFWAMLYAGSLTTPPVTITDPEVKAGQTLYNSQCAGCHGQEGTGGQGRKLSEGEVLLTFPVGQRDEMITWVKEGTEGVGIGNGFGDPARPGGQHIAGAFNGSNMPGFAETLTDEEILAIVRYEREILGGMTAEEVAADNAEGSATGSASDTTAP